MENLLKVYLHSIILQILEGYSKFFFILLNHSNFFLKKKPHAEQLLNGLQLNKDDLIITVEFKQYLPEVTAWFNSTQIAL